MIFTFEDYGKTAKQLAKEIRKYKLFPLFREEMRQQVYLAPYLALGQNPEVVIAIGKSKVGYCKRKNTPNRAMNQYGDFIILSKEQMLQVCRCYLEIEDVKKELKNANQK